MSYLKKKIRINFSFCTAEGTLDLSLFFFCSFSPCLWRNTFWLENSPPSLPSSLTAKSHSLRMTLIYVEKNKIMSQYFTPLHIWQFNSLLLLCSYKKKKSSTYFYHSFSMYLSIWLKTVGIGCVFPSVQRQCCRDTPRNVDSPESLQASAAVCLAASQGHPCVCLSGALLFKGWTSSVPLNTPCARLRRSLR